MLRVENKQYGDFMEIETCWNANRHGWQLLTKLTCATPDCETLMVKTSYLFFVFDSLLHTTRAIQVRRQWRHAWMGWKPPEKGGHESWIPSRRRGFCQLSLQWDTNTLAVIVSGAVASSWSVRSSEVNMSFFKVRGKTFWEYESSDTNIYHEK